MSIDRYSRTIPASGVIETGRGNFCLFTTAAALVDLRLENGGHAEQFNSISGGIIIRRIKPWDNLRILGAAGTTVEFYIGYEPTDRDEVDIRLQIATLSGISLVSIAPASSHSTGALTAVANAAAETIAANLLRRRITVCAPDSNTGVVYVQTAGAGAERGIPLGPGQFVELQNTAAIDVRNDSGAAQQFSYFEE